MTWITEIEAFQEHLGGHQRHYPDAGRNDLTLPELGALVVVAGRKAGFTVKTEVTAMKGDNSPRIDCAWFSPGITVAVVAWEFDAYDVGKPHLYGTEKRWGTVEKLRKFRVPTKKIQALYRLRGEVKSAGFALKKGFVAPGGIKVLTDIQLMEGQIVAIARRARQRAEIR